MLGDTFDIPGFYTWHLVMAILLCVVWLVLFVLTAVAFWRGEIFLARSEDVLRDTMLSREEAEREKEAAADGQAHEASLGVERRL